MAIFQIPFHQNQPSGSQEFTTPGTSTFNVPADVTRISVVCVGGGGAGSNGAANDEAPGGGGGGLRWVAGLPVNPGENLTVTVGVGGTGGVNGGRRDGGASSVARGATVLISAGGGRGGSGNNITGTGGTGGSGSFDTSIIGIAGITTGGGNGGFGGRQVDGTSNGGGGGSGGYTGVGGTGGTGSNVDGAAGVGGAGGGGEASSGGNNDRGGGGGGVGIYGQGTNGAGGSGNVRDPGSGGSGGADGASNTINPAGGNYGGGGGGACGNNTSGAGAPGAVRIIWGPTRYYPTTNTDQYVEFVGFSTSSASTIVIPSIAQEGDIAFLFDNAYSNVTPSPTSVIPTNWTSAATGAGANDGISVYTRGNCSYKILTSTDPGTTISGMNGVSGNRKTMLVFRPNFTATSLTLSTPVNSNTSGDPLSQDILISAGTSPLIALAHMGTYTGAVATRSVTGGSMTEVSNGANQYVQYAIYDSWDALTDSTVDIADGGVNTLQSFYAIVNTTYTQVG